MAITISNSIYKLKSELDSNFLQLTQWQFRYMSVQSHTYAAKNRKRFK